MARSEKALADAFDGPDAEPLRWPSLPGAAGIMARLMLAPHPTAIRLSFATNAAQHLVRAQGGGAAVKPVRLPEPQAILVWREDFMARFRPLSPRKP